MSFSFTRSSRHDKAIAAALMDDGTIRAALDLAVGEALAGIGEHVTDQRILQLIEENAVEGTTPRTDEDIAEIATNVHNALALSPTDAVNYVRGGFEQSRNLDNTYRIAGSINPPNAQIGETYFVMVQWAYRDLFPATPPSFQVLMGDIVLKTFRETIAPAATSDVINKTWCDTIHIFEDFVTDEIANLPFTFQYGLLTDGETRMSGGHITAWRIKAAPPPPVPAEAATLLLDKYGNTELALSGFANGSTWLIEAAFEPGNIPPAPWTAGWQIEDAAGTVLEFSDYDLDPATNKINIVLRTGEDNTAGSATGNIALVVTADGTTYNKTIPYNWILQ